MRAIGIVATAMWACFGSYTAIAEDCEARTTPWIKAICADVFTQTSYDKVLTTYSKALSQLSQDGQRFLRMDQDRWEARTRASCLDHPAIYLSHKGDELPPQPATKQEDGTYRDAPINGGTTSLCLWEQFLGRAASLSVSLVHKDGFIWQDVNLSYDTYCSSGHGATNNRISFELSAVRIEAPDNEATRAWNARHDPEVALALAESPDACAHDGLVLRWLAVTFSQGDFLELLTQDLVMYYEGQNYSFGPPRYGKQTERVALELLSSGRTLAANDFFVQGSGWEGFIAKRAYADYLSGLKENDRKPILTEADYIAAAADIDHWRIDEKTLTYEFVVTDLADFGSSTSFTWKELRPYLRNDLPFQPGFR